MHESNDSHVLPQKKRDGFSKKNTTTKTEPSKVAT